MRPGDLVTPRKIENHAAKCYRIFDMWRRSVKDPEATFGLRFQRVVGKFNIGEPGLVLEVEEEEGYAKVLTPRGAAGWMKVEFLVGLGGDT